MPQGMFQSRMDDKEKEKRNKYSWFKERREFLAELEMIMPSSHVMRKIDKEANDLYKITNFNDAMQAFQMSTGFADEKSKRQEKLTQVLSFTWNYMFFLLFYRQIIVHEFFMFCVWKKLKAPMLEAVDQATQDLVNNEETEDDIMHTSWHNILNNFSLFRDILMGAKDNFTTHFQRYMNLSHERIKISHERNMKRSEDIVFNTVTS